MEDDIKALREEIAKLHERVAVLEAAKAAPLSQLCRQWTQAPFPDQGMPARTQPVLSGSPFETTGYIAPFYSGQDKNAEIGGPKPTPSLMHAIGALKWMLDTSERNARIDQSQGKHDRANLELARAADIRAALAFFGISSPEAVRWAVVDTEVHKDSVNAL
ncbi:hypothetical protein J2W35_004935 [Variovorax boronicumulans]|uniref:hypothetical protein n=1 Tax=Variovorax boronicumulans TaxID=436515 RepID=UPI0027829BFF|nr:hypothetical protein [Variovorax boronicumulans]MDQ0084566.1 hypothetical protein [Variovorax boronicumulans]